MKKLILLTWFISFISFDLYSQAINDTLYFPITHHIITRGDGTGAVMPNEIDLAMQELNKAFAPAGIQFYMSCVGIDTNIN